MWLYFYTKNNIFGVSSDGLVSPDLLIEIKIGTVGSTGPPEDLRKIHLYSFKHNYKWYVLVQSIA